VKYLRLVFRNVERNRRRTILTVLSITMSLFLISTLKTLLDELENPPTTPESAKRLFTRHKVSLGVMMPLAYREKIRAVPGVEDATTYQWFGGIYKDPQNFFAQFAVDADRLFAIYPEYKIDDAAHIQDFIKERTAALAGVKLAKKYGWKLGDRITLKGTFTRFDVETTIRGFLDGGGSENTYFFHYDYFNELGNNAGQIGTFSIKAKSAEDIPAISDSIDAMFANSTAPTKTESEKAFFLSFISMYGNVRLLVMSISTVVLFTIILVAANTMAMSIRERTGEIAILKTLGFTPGQVLGMTIAESLFIALAGGLLGSLGARLAYGSVDLNDLSQGLVPEFVVSWGTVAMAAGISIVVAFTSTLLPAWGASRLSIADAIRRRGE
jgi:putative ABC transport system permease protein